MSSAKHESIGTDAFMRDALELTDAQPNRPVDFFRISELVKPRGPFSRSWLIRKLHSGELKAVRLGELTLIEGPSLRELLKSSKTWTPPR